MTPRLSPTQRAVLIALASGRRDGDRYVMSWIDACRMAGGRAQYRSVLALIKQDLVARSTAGDCTLTPKGRELAERLKAEARTR
jgi:hypothetical protein